MALSCLRQTTQLYQLHVAKIMTFLTGDMRNGRKVGLGQMTKWHFLKVTKDCFPWGGELFRGKAWATGLGDRSAAPVAPAWNEAVPPPGTEQKGSTSPFSHLTQTGEDVPHCCANALL